MFEPQKFTNGQEDSSCLSERIDKKSALVAGIESEGQSLLSQEDLSKKEKSEQEVQNQRKGDESKEEIEVHGQVAQNALLDASMIEEKSRSNKLNDLLNEQCIEQLSMPQVVAESEEISDPKNINNDRDLTSEKMADYSKGEQLTTPRSRNLIGEEKTEILEMIGQLIEVATEMEEFSGRSEYDYAKISACKRFEGDGIKSPYL